MMPVSTEEANQLLKRCVGEDAEFHKHQWEAINKLVNNREKLLLVQRTGWGKSTVYFIATKLLRDRGEGPTLIVSPLLSLMRNQIEEAEQELGLNAISINSTNSDERDKLEGSVKEGECDILLISPEQLANDEFRKKVLNEVQGGIGMLVIDEAHCISDWGHDFRPDYRRIQSILTELPDDIPIAATTATANDRVVEDVTEQIRGLNPLRGDLLRESLKIQAIEIGDKERRLAWLSENVSNPPYSGVIYCLTTRDTELVSSWLEKNGIDAPAYHGRMENETREELEEMLVQNEVDALVATNALGMGFNKKDLGFVIHYQRPPDVIRYYQEIGRAGRGIGEAYAILLSGDEDNRIAEYFIESAFPEKDDFERILSVIEESEEPLYERQIMKRIDLGKGLVDKCTNILDVEEAIDREEDGYVRTHLDWEYDKERIERVTKDRWEELERMKEFTSTDMCLMRYISDELDGRLNEDCGRCANCTSDFLPTYVRNEDRVEKAADHCRNHGQRVIGPRKTIPKKYERNTVREEIKGNRRLEAGRALCNIYDAGWGRVIRENLDDGTGFDRDLVEASAELIDDWGPDPFPVWLTAIPSTSNSGIVTDFAERLSESIGIEFVETVEVVGDKQPQQEMENSYQNRWNVEGVFEVEEVLDGPVLLVDDTVCSRWTLTEVGMKLKQAGSGSVYPYVLAERR